MFNIGDLVIYPAHGICKIGDIIEKTVLDNSRLYYVLHPIENNDNLTISTPVNNEKAVIHELINKEEAIEILESFKDTEIQWIENPHRRNSTYSDIINTGDRKEIANIVNTLLRYEIELETQNKKLHKQDSQLLNTTRSTLFQELAISLDTNLEAIDERVTDVIKGP